MPEAKYRNAKKCDTCKRNMICTYMKYATAQRTTVTNRVREITCKNCPCMSKFGTCLRYTQSGCKNHEDK